MLCFLICISCTTCLTAVRGGTDWLETEQRFWHPLGSASTQLYEIERIKEANWALNCKDLAIKPTAASCACSRNYVSASEPASGSTQVLVGRLRSPRAWRQYLCRPTRACAESISVFRAKSYSVDFFLHLGIDVPAFQRSSLELAKNFSVAVQQFVKAVEKPIALVFGRELQIKRYLLAGS